MCSIYFNDRRILLPCIGRRKGSTGRAKNTNIYIYEIKIKRFRRNRFGVTPLSCKYMLLLAERGGLSLVYSSPQRFISSFLASKIAI